MCKNVERVHDLLKGAITKLKIFWNANSRSSIAHEIVERICDRSFPYPNATRWNSKFDSIDIAEKNKIKINEAIEEISKEARKSSSNSKKHEKLNVE